MAGFVARYDIEQRDMTALVSSMLRRRPNTQLARAVIAVFSIAAAVQLASRSLSGTVLHLVPAGSALILAGIAVSQIFLPNLLAYRYMRRRRGDLLYTAHAAPEALTCTSRGVTHTLPWDRVTHLTLRGNYLEIAGGGMAAVIATRALPAGLSPDMALTACRMWAAQARRPATPPPA